MSPDALLEELEADYAWRQGEILSLQNSAAVVDEKMRRHYSRALVLLVYAHVEGYAKFALLLYVRVVNEAGLRCADVKEAIVAASLSDVFGALRNNSAKSDHFRSIEDARIQILHREQEFVRSLGQLMDKPAFIPDAAIDTENNLWAIVLKKNLFRLGVPFAHFDEIWSSLDVLVNMRNSIAHGSASTDISWKAYLKMRDVAFGVMSGLQRSIFSAADLKFYRRLQA